MDSKAREKNINNFCVGAMPAGNFFDFVYIGKVGFKRRLSLLFML